MLVLIHFFFRAGPLGRRGAERSVCPSAVAQCLSPNRCPRVRRYPLFFFFIQITAKCVGTDCVADVEILVLSAWTLVVRVWGVEEALGTESKQGACRGTSLIRNSTPLGPCSRTLPRALWRSQGGRLFLISEVCLYYRHRSMLYRGHSHITVHSGPHAFAAALVSEGFVAPKF